MRKFSRCPRYESGGKTDVKCFENDCFLNRYNQLKTANILLNKLIEEITLEFPSINDVPQILTDRHYENISDEFWKHKL